MFDSLLKIFQEETILFFHQLGTHFLVSHSRMAEGSHQIKEIKRLMFSYKQRDEKIS